VEVVINGIKLYYEKNGSGSPIILLHGNGEDHTIFDKLAEKLSEDFTVYMPDSRCHGQSGAGRLDYELMADDIVGFIRALDLNKPVLYGFSDGGIIGLIIAIKYTALLSKLIVSGVNTNPLGLKSRFLLSYGWQYLIKRSVFDRLILTQPHVKKNELAKIKIPVLLTAGEKDMIRERHTKTVANAIPGSRLIILPGENHGSYIVHSDKMNEIIKKFCCENG
jgi:pimeloyl-ACP methyl ester carboxylesterase